VTVACRTIRHVVRQCGAQPQRARPSAGGTTRSHHAEHDEVAIRRYLRALVGAPVKGAERLDDHEAAFVDAVPRWSARAGVDRRTLLKMGVERRVLDRAGLRQPPAAELVRQHYPESPFSVADLARSSGIAANSVRQAVTQDEADGLLQRVGKDGRVILYGLVR
jgi:hypothetical protein